MTLKVEQVEIVTYQPREVIVCDGPQCEQRGVEREITHWWMLRVVGEPHLVGRHFCSSACLVKWMTQGTTGNQ